MSGSIELTCGGLELPDTSGKSRSVAGGFRLLRRERELCVPWSPYFLFTAGGGLAWT